jgi:hypothetical protein
VGSVCLDKVSFKGVHVRRRSGPNRGLQWGGASHEKAKPGAKSLKRHPPIIGVPADRRLKVGGVPEPYTSTRLDLMPNPR